MDLATSADLETIYAFQQANLPDAWSLTALQAALDSPYQRLCLLKRAAVPAAAIEGLVSEVPIATEVPVTAVPAATSAQQEREIIVALLHYQIVDSDCNIFNIAVNPDYRQQGIAGTLLQLLAAWLKHDEASAVAVLHTRRWHTALPFAAYAFAGRICNNCFLEVRLSNVKAVSVYRHAGYEILRRIPRFYKEAAYGRQVPWDYQGEDALQLRRCL